MTPKGKAKDLVGKYYQFVDCGNNTFTTDIQVINAKECALVAIDEIFGMVDEDSLYFDYWVEVKEEILKM